MFLLDYQGCFPTYFSVGRQKDLAYFDKSRSEWPKVNMMWQSMRGRRRRYGLCTRSVMVVAIFCCCKTSFFLWHGFHHGAGLGTSILATLGYATSRNGGGGGFTAMRRAGRAARRRCCRPFCLWPPQHIRSRYLIFVPKLCIPCTLNTFRGHP